MVGKKEKRKKNESAGSAAGKNDAENVYMVSSNM